MQALDPLLSGWPGDVVVLDGGLATALEARGHDLSDALWSARLLLDGPESIREVHAAFLDAGADCIISASYQASLEGFAARGLGTSEARERLRLAVTLACEARDTCADGNGRRRPLVAASVGPWGATRADGSEYTGDYGRDSDWLRGFHRERFALLADSGADLLACETLPSRAEVRALLRLLDETPGARAWLSFTARDPQHLADGTPLAELARELDHERVVAVGVNCVPPGWVTPLLGELRRGCDKPLVAYPNSGERWDATRRGWSGAGEAPDAGAAARAWRAAGARLIGGCCRVSPEAIRQLRRELQSPLPGREATPA